MAAQVTDEISATEPVVAALVVGSTALRRCSPRADLDLVVVTSSTPGQDRFESRTVDGVRVEIERLSRREALAVTAGGGWVWELRQAARIGCHVPILDPEGFAEILSRRAAAMTPWPDRFEETLRQVYLLIVDLGRDTGDPVRRMDALRGCLDNLTLLALLEHPRRYQKAKWALADLLHAGERRLVGAILAAYGIGRSGPDSDATSAREVVAGGRRLIDGVYRHAGLPDHELILGMGHAPELAEASYVSRCLEDAEDLESSGRFVEAQYAAKFACRLAAGLLAQPDADGGLLDTLAAAEGDDLVSRYLFLFPSPDGPGTDLLESALTVTDARRHWLESLPGQPAAMA